ncbi:not available [Yersinia enterocolitica]|nr:not available [Yersinia enterocolitica]
MISGSFFIKLGVKFKDKNINEYKSFNAFGLQCFCNILF